MVSSTFIIAIMILLAAFIAGRSYESSRNRRRFSRVLDEALSRAGIRRPTTTPALTILDPQLLCSQDRQHYEILRLCEVGAWSKALTFIQAVGVNGHHRGLHELYVRLLLKCGRVQEVENTIDALHKKGGTPRLIYGALIACKRWSDALAFYGAQLQTRQGSLRETHLLELLVSLSQSKDASSGESARVSRDEIRAKMVLILKLEETGRKVETIGERVIEQGFKLGVRCLAEMSAWVTFEKKLTLCESQAQRMHHIDSSDCRVDWSGLALGKLRAGIESSHQPPLLLEAVEVVSRSHLECHRVYRCNCCEVLYGPFSVVCPSCFTVGLGEPIRGTLHHSGAEMFSDCGFELDVLEVLYWDLILPPSEVDSGG